VGKDGKEKAYKVKLAQSESGASNLFFSLILRDALGLRKNEAVRNAIQENFKGHESLDVKTGLPDRLSLIKDIELMKYYASRGNIQSCFGILQIDLHDNFRVQYGDEVFNNLLKHIALIARQSLRPDDVLTSVGNGRIGVLLVDVALDSVRIAFNRLRWQIAANPYILPDQTSIGVSVSIHFCYISQDVAEEEIVKRCENSINTLGNSKKNTLVEVAVV
jgi:diguanylate cyclase